MTQGEKTFKYIDFILLDLISVAISFFAAFYGYHYIKLNHVANFDMYDGAYRIIVALIFLIHLFYAFSGDIYTDILRRKSVEEVRLVTA